MVALAPIPQQIVDIATRDRPRPYRSGGGGKLEPATPEVQRVFRELMALAGVYPNGHVQEMVKCVNPAHDDWEASLNIHWQAAALYCHGSCNTGGRIGTLRQWLGVKAESVPRTAPTPFRSGERNGNKVERVDRERGRHRLVSAMREWGGLFAEYDRNSGRIFYEKVIECGVTASKYECPVDGSRKIRKSYCDIPLCPVSVPPRLRADFKRHAKNLPERLDLYVWSPPEGRNSRKQITSAFNHWRQLNGITAGFYGVRLQVGHPDVLLVLPAGAPCPLEAVATNCDLENTIEWYTEKYVEEITSWKTPEDMVNLLEAVKGRRKFQGFGSYFQKQKEEEDVRVIPNAEKKLGKVSGGSGKRGKEPVTCDHCGGKMRYVGQALTAEDAEAWLNESSIRNNPQSKPRQAA